jgi:hypothetical protein
MGYHISSLGTLAVHPEIELYIFVINGDFRGPHFKALQDAFRSIASNIGEKNAIVEGLSAEFSGDVCRQYLDEDIRVIWDALPALLITDAHPKAITGRTLRLFAPLKWAEQKFGDLETFFRGLAAFAHTRDSSFLEHFRPKGRLLEAADKTVEIKPAIAGFSVNGNEFIRQIRRRPSSTMRLQRKFQPRDGS